jgi:chromate transport protein ChrA
MYLANLLGGPVAAALAVLPYILPGVLIAIVLSFLIFGFERPAWANGAIHGLSAGALALFFVNSMRTLPSSRKARLGPLAVVAAFLAHAIFEVDLLLVLAGCGAVSLLLNRPHTRLKERA